MKSALIFPGQGAQRPGMGREFYDRYRFAKEVFNEVDDALGFALSEIIFNGKRQNRWQQNECGKIVQV